MDTSLLLKMKGHIEIYSFEPGSKFPEPGTKFPTGANSDILGFLLRSAMAGRLYKLHSKQTSNSGFDQTFMPCSGYILFAAEQRVGYQISCVDLQLPIARGKLVCEFDFHKEASICPAADINATSISFSKKLVKVKRPKAKTSLIGKECERTSHQ